MIENGRICIICTAGGWNIVARIDEIGPEWIVLGPRLTVIRWGTTDGLEQIFRGPTSETKLSAVTRGKGMILLVNALRIDEVDQGTWGARLGLK